MRLRLLTLLAALVAVAVAGCGGSSEGSASGEESAASLVPESAVAFVAVNTDFDSDQWKTVDGLLRKFPSREQLLASLRQSLTKEGLDWNGDVKPALGKELDVAVLSIQTSASGPSNASFVAFLKPDDEAKFKALLKKSNQSGGSQAVTDKVEGWTVVSDKRSSIAAIKDRKGKALADDDDFNDAMDELPAEALAKVYVAGPGLQQALSQSQVGAGASALATGNLKFVTAAVEAKSNGLKTSGTATSSGKTKTPSGRSAFVSEAPAGAYAFISFHGSDRAFSSLRSNPQVAGFLPQLEASLGVKLDQLAALFKNEGALWVRQGTPIPEITLALKVDDERQAMSIVDRLATRGGRFAGGVALRPITIAGVSAKQLNLGRFSIFYATFGGNLVVTSAQTGISDLKAGGSKLADDSVFKSAKKAAAMPDSTSGFVYVNLHDSIPLIESLAQLGGESLPREAQGNLAPLQSFLAYGSSSGGKATFTAFLEIK